MQLTNKQKELFQKEKHILVDSIISLQDKVLKLMDEVKGLQNQMLLNNQSWNKRFDILKKKSINELTKNELEKSNLAHQADIATIKELMDELETERSMRVKLEKAHITAQEEIDVLNKDVKEISNLDNDAFLHALQDKIDKFYIKALEEKEKVEEEGENGTL